MKKRIIAIILGTALVMADCIPAAAAADISADRAEIVSADTVDEMTGVMNEDAADETADDSGTDTADEAVDVMNEDAADETADVMNEDAADETADDAGLSEGRVYRLDGRIVENTACSELDLEDEVLQFGGMPGPDGYSADSPDLKSEIEDAINGAEESLDVSSYHMDIDEITDIVAEAVNDNPTFYNFTGSDVVYDEETGVVLEIMFGYDEEQTERELTYEREVTFILNNIGPDWSDAEKLLYLHDYIVTTCQYDYTYKRSGAYDVIVEHSAVCNGYALAFQDLARRAGIPTEKITCWALDHAWNAVELDGKHYYIDCTWDDPGTGGGAHWFERFCTHENFVRSREEMIGTGHRDGTEPDDTGNSSDGFKKWVNDDSTNVFDVYNDGEYANSFWDSASFSPTVCLDGYAIYINNETDRICRYDFADNTSSDLVGYELDPYDWGYNYGLAGNADGVFFSTADKIYYLGKPSAGYSMTLIHTLTQEESSYTYSGDYIGYGELYGISTDGNTLYYYVQKDYSDTGVIKKGTLDISAYTGITASSVSLNRTLIAFTAAGATKQLSATVTPASAADVEWSSSDENVAVVDENGTVTSTGYGSCVICARAGGRYDLCTVQVNTVWQNDFSGLNIDAHDRLQISWYEGTARNLVIPATACVRGRVVATKVGAGSFCNLDSVESIVFEEGVLVSDLFVCFERCPKLKTVDMSGCVFDGPCSFHSAFNGCSSLETVIFPEDMGSSSVNNTGFMFSGCSKLKKLDLSMLDLSAVTESECMFQQCRALEEIHTPQALPSDLTNEDGETISAALPVTMYEYTDGIRGESGYTDLMTAPVSTVIYKTGAYKTAINKATVTLDDDGCVYTGKPVEPACTVTLGDRTLIRDTDYTLTCRDNTDAGEDTAVAVITGIGEFEGEAEFVFSISKAEQVISAAVPRQTIYTGQSIPVTVTGAKGDVTYESADADVLTVDEDGVITGTGIGTAEVIITSAETSNYKATVIRLMIEVTDLPAVSVPRADTASGIIAGNTSVKITCDTPGAVICYTTDGTTEPALDEDGRPANEATYIYEDPVSVRRSMTLWIKAYRKNMRPSTASYEYLVEEDWGDLEDNTVLKEAFADSTEIPDGIWYAVRDAGGYGERIYTDAMPVRDTDIARVYTGSKITFDEGIEVYHSNRRLVQNRDYTVSYSYNTNTGNPGSLNRSHKSCAPVFRISGKGDYSGTASFRFTIEARSLDEAVRTSEDSVAVTAGRKVKLSDIKPKLTYRGRALKQNTDYVLRYYRGESTLEEDLISDPAKEIISEGGLTYTIQAAAKAGSNYTGVMPGTVSVRSVAKSDNTRACVTALKYGNSKGKAIKISIGSLSSEDMAYYLKDGSLDPARLFDNSNETCRPLAYVYIKKADKPLIYGTDYTVEPVVSTDHKSAGKHGFVIRGKERSLSDEELAAGRKSYVGSLNGFYEITGISMNKVKIAGLAADVQYTGAAITIDDLFKANDKTVRTHNAGVPEEEKWTGVTLYRTYRTGKTTGYITLNGAPAGSDGADAADYVYSMHNIGITGKFTLTMTGQGMYTGTIRRTVKVKPYDIKKDVRGRIIVQSDETDGEGCAVSEFRKNGSAPGVRVLYVTGWKEDGVSPDAWIELREGIDYTPAYKNNTKPVTDTGALYALKASARPAVVIKGRGNYTGSNSSCKFCITKTDITRNVRVDAADVVYNSKGKNGYCLKIPKLTDGGKALKAGRNKDIESLTKSNCRYYYVEECALADGTHRYEDDPVDKKDRILPGTWIRVEVTVTCSAKSPYLQTEDCVLTGYYRVIAKNRDVSKAKMAVKNASALEFNNADRITVLKRYLKVYFKGVPGELGTDDYDIVEVKNNLIPGTATVIIKGKGEYGGTGTFTVKIGKRKFN